MAYRFGGVDPFLRTAIGTFDGYMMRGGVLSEAALLKRNSVGSWQGIHVVDDGGSGNHSFRMEFNPSNQVAGDFTTSNPFASAATFNNTVDWLILGYTWDGTNGAGGITWRWRFAGDVWQSEAETTPGAGPTPTVGSTFRHLIGNEAGLGDDAGYDLCAIGAIEANLDQATFESVDMLSFDTWKTVYAGSGAWLLGFESIGTQLDRAGNGGDEVSRSAGITLVSDPPGWEWVSGVVDNDYSFFPKPKLRRRVLTNT